MELKKFISIELLKLESKGIKVVDFQIDSPLIKFVIAIEQSAVYFVVTDDNQFQILSVVHNGKKYVQDEYLSQFDGFIEDVVALVMPIVKGRTAEYMRCPDMIEYREQQAKFKEDHLEKRALEVQAREQLLEFQIQAVEMENKLLEDEKIINETQKMRKWTRENNFLFRWSVIAVVVVLISLMLYVMFR